MSAQVRLIHAEEVGRWAQSTSVPFLDPANTEDKRAQWESSWRPLVELGRTWAAEDRGRFVGNACTLTRTVTMPGPPGEPCPVVPFAAVTAVGVHPTHRRRGLLGQLMEAMLTDARERGEALAGLLASESSIYGRFGFGPATQVASYALDARAAAFAVPAPPAEMELLAPAEAAKVLPGLFERACARQPGQVDRPEAAWAKIFDDPAAQREGASARAYVTCADGFAIWRSEQVVDPHDEWARVKVEALVGTTAAAEAALWRFLLDLDLVREVQAFRRPLDEPLRYRLADPRQLRTTSVSDFLWLRILDTPAALCGRGYLRPGRLVLDVQAPTAGSGPDPAVGRWVLDAAEDGSTCRPAGPGDATDLVIGVAELSAVLAGGTRASVLAAAGRIGEERRGALDSADAVFASRPAPLSITAF
jgi:predicted acetyltransferase